MDIAQAVTCARITLRNAPYSDGKPSVQALLSYVARKLGNGEQFEIKIRQFSGDPDVVRALVQRSRNSAIIRVADGNNTCWTRFTVIKELMQLLVDDDSSFIDDIVAQLNLVREMVRGGARELHSEDFAMFAAIEYSYQLSSRVQPPISSSREIAKRLRVPQVLIERFYSPDWANWSEYANASAQIHQLLDEEQALQSALNP